jgi:hypothetical protein
MLQYFPQLLFGSVGALCFALVLMEWNVRHRLALLSLSVAGFSLVCFAVDHAWTRYSIRVDLLLTIPAVSLSALVAGTLAAVRPSLPARAVGALLAMGGAVSLAWYSYAVHRSAVEDARTMALFDEGTRLFWNETIRCQDNFDRRFGPFKRRDDPCLGDLVVLSRSPNAYPFVARTRARLYLSSEPSSAFQWTTNPWA